MRCHRRTDPLLPAVLKSATPTPPVLCRPLLPLNPAIVSASISSPSFNSGSATVLYMLPNVTLYTLIAASSRHPSISPNLSFQKQSTSKCTSTSGSLASKATATSLRPLNHPLALLLTATLIISKGPPFFGPQYARQRRFSYVGP